MKTYTDYKKIHDQNRVQVETYGCFFTKTAKTEALDTLSRAFEKYVSENKNYHSKEAKDKGYNFWDMPSSLHHVREKHNDVFSAFGVNPIVVRHLVRDRDYLKSFDVVKKVSVKKEYKPTERQATHLGSCQVCGSVQKVNKSNGTIASHGYTKDFSFHHGECVGSRAEPYEISNSFLIKYAVILDARVAQIEENLAVENTLIFNVRELRQEKREIINHVLPRIANRYSNWKLSSLTKIL